MYKATLVFCLHILLSIAAVAQTSELFLAQAEAPLGPFATSSQRVDIDVDLLSSAPHFSVAVPGSEELRIERLQLERRGHDDLTWRGKVTGEPSSSVTLTLRGGLVVGRIQAGGKVWAVRTLPGGGQAIDLLEPSLFPGCDTPVHQGGSAFLGATDPCPNPADSVQQIAILGVYTPQARDAAGGTSAIEATLQGSVDISNSAFERSEVAARFQLVGTMLADHNDSGSSSTDLNWLINDPEVAAKRNEVQADLVGMLGASIGGGCGRGQLPLNWSNPTNNVNAVHQVTALGCAIGNLSFPHEHGHNMGLEHDPPNANAAGSGTYSVRYGHTVNGSYRTVMAYSNQCGSGCGRVAQFSNPEVLFAGQPTGIADERNNSLVLSFTDGCVADYRIGGSVFRDGFENGATSEWWVTVP